jgi:multidrug efflux system membrane fusion protein
MLYRHKITILASIAVLLTGCSDDAPPAPKAIPVLATPVVLEDVPLFLESTGKLNASTVVSIIPEVSGRLIEAHVKDGAVVHKDQQLFRVDSELYEIALRQAKAQFDLDKANLEATVRKAERYETLSQKDLISKQEWDELQTKVAAAEATLEQDAARLQAAQRDLNHCTITAPTTGRVGSTSLDVGNWVSPSTLLTTICECNPISVQFTLTEKEFSQLMRTKSTDFIPIEMCSLCEEGSHARGEVTFIDHSFDPQTGLLKLSGKFPNPNWRFLPGQHVHIKVPVSTIQAAHVLPTRAVKNNQEGSYVFVIKEDETVEQRQVKIGEEYDTKVVVIEGLKEGERVVTEGHLRLFPGIRVEVKSE